MQKPALHDITFDKEDALLFSYSDDLLLKAKAIQNSILPKLQVLLQESVALVRKIYGIEVFDEDSTLSKYPSFREKRENSLQINYETAGIGITGSRTPIWDGFQRNDGKPVKIIPVSLRYELSENGLILCFLVDGSIKLHLYSFRKIFSFLLEFKDEIQALTSFFGFEIKVGHLNEMLTPLKDVLTRILKANRRNDYSFAIQKLYPMPLGEEKSDLDFAVVDFCALFPVYYEILQVAQGKATQFGRLLKKLRNCILDDIKATANDKLSKSTDGGISNPKNTTSYSVIKELAERRIDDIGIRASIRWQVFERDDFRCVACGATALDGAILHIDHILPRSKGGTDTMENYQTLCQTCNIGKSNHSERNLRERS